MGFRTRKWSFTIAPVLTALALMTACDDDPIAPTDPADAVVAVRLTIGTETVEIPEGQGGTSEIPLGSTNVSTQFLDEDGAVVAGLEDEFELRIESDDESIVTFTSTGTFTGTLNGESAGTTSVKVQLFHVEEGHEDAEWNVAVTVG